MKQKKGITLVALVVTIIILLILAGVGVSMILGENGIFSKTHTAAQKYNAEEAKEKMELKKIAIQAKSLSEENKIADLQYIADELCEDDEVEYVKQGKAIAKLDKIDVTGYSSILVKLKAYENEFEIGQDMQVAVVGGTGTGGSGGSSAIGGIEDSLETLGSGIGLVTFDLNGGDDYDGPLIAGYKYGKIVKGLLNDVPTKDGYAFLGWDEDIDATIPTYRQNGTTAFEMPERNVTLHAIWPNIVRADELEEGMIVRYNGKLYVVLYQEKDNSTKYTGTVKYTDETNVTIDGATYTYPEDLKTTKTQIVSLDSLGTKTLGSSGYSTAKSQWDDAASILNTAARDVVTENGLKELDTGLTVRCVGSIPTNYSSLSGDSDDNYLTDLYQLTKLGRASISTTSPDGYWIVSRYSYWGRMVLGPYGTHGE